MTHGSVLEVSPKLLDGIKRKATESENNKGVSVLQKFHLYVIFVEGSFFTLKETRLLNCYVKIDDKNITDCKNMVCFCNSQAEFLVE